MSRSLSRALQEREALLAADPGMAGVFFHDGAPLPRGALFRQPALGATLQRLATDGPGALYGGAIGERYAAGLRAVGAPIVVDDLAAHSADVVAPLSGRYRDLDVRVVPPNSQGFALLEMLALVERLGIDPDPLGPDAGVLALAFAAANRDRDHHLADPDAMRVHPSTLLDDGHLAGLADRIRDAAPPTAVPGHRHGTGDTIAMVTADADGWAVSLIQSLWDSFGSAILEPETGIVAHDRGGCFTLEPGHPNEIAPGKRPFHTLMPVLVHRDGRLAAVAGSMGGASQPQINAQNLIRAFDLGMGAGETIAAPRWTVWGEPGEGVVRGGGVGAGCDHGPVRGGGLPDRPAGRRRRSRRPRAHDPRAARRDARCGQRPASRRGRAGALTSEPPDSPCRWPITPRCRAPAASSDGCAA